MERAETAFKSGTPNDAAGISTIFFIFMYAPCKYSSFEMGNSPGGHVQRYGTLNTLNTLLFQQIDAELTDSQATISVTTL